MPARQHSPNKNTPPRNFRMRPECGRGAELIKACGPSVEEGPSQ
jgi:hypothetical protein